MKPIYIPKGAAKEYCNYALNIYTGCPHRCYYCFAPLVLHRNREEFHSHVEPRKNIVEETRKQIEIYDIKDKLIQLCFTCDPYPTGYDTSTTREIIKLLKESGNHVQILTKGDGRRDFDLLDANDWYGITIDGSEEANRDFIARMWALEEAKRNGIRTWCSFEPVLNDTMVLLRLKYMTDIDKVMIGKLNYHPSDINWKEFGREAEELCQRLGIDYYIKDSLRKEMKDKALEENDE